MRSLPPPDERSEAPAVLIVDDVEANLVAMRALLEGVNCTVTSVSSGEQALRALLRTEYAVMLLDVQMPGMNGYEVASHARSNPSTKDVPIIFLTASHGSPENVARGYGSGAVDYLSKPLDSTVLLSKVRVFLELHQSRRQLAAANTRLALRNAELQATAAAESAVAAELRRTNVDLNAAYRELQAAQAQLVQSAKMASLGELVAGVAHEINNPLAFVLSHLESTRKYMDQFRARMPVEAAQAADEPYQRARARMQEVDVGLHRIRELVLKLRTFSRLDEGERKFVSFRECVESVLTILHHRTSERIRVVTDFQPPDFIDCYPGLLNQVLLNLVANSIDAIEGEGVITISGGGQGQTFAISVADTGAGIPPELRERALEPFFTTKPVGKGTGLGLSIAYSIVKRHAGTIELTDRSGGGTDVKIVIPLKLPSA
ncbi:MAG: Signal transduction histidine kinase [Polyangiaceae bacterium]|jgi:two-component system NtrC family sensor kinase|nr:Signal transduction histidine kinase [Polyangiaceae bacterium]